MVDNNLDVVNDNTVTAVEKVKKKKIKRRKKIQYPNVWAITTFYKFFNSPYREANYKTFKKNLNDAGVQLAVIEITAPGIKPTLKEGTHADKILRLETKSLLWHKERSLNMLSQILPKSCEYIAWFDIDCVLHNSNWPTKAIEKLEEGHLAVQLCSHIDFEDSNGKIAQSKHTYTYMLAQKGNKPRTASGRIDGSPGFCWMMKLKEFKQIYLYDCAIIGGGDLLFADAVCFNNTGRLMLSNGNPNAPYYQHYRKWKNNVMTTFNEKLPATCLEGGSTHLYHDEKKYRMYNIRHYLLVIEQYNPLTDLEEEATGLWKLKNQNIKNILETYFWLREQTKNDMVENLFNTINIMGTHIKDFIDNARKQKLNHGS